MTERTIFLTALEKPLVERTAYLDQACGGDSDLRQRVEGLLRSHGEAGDFLDVPAMAQIAPAGRPENPGGVTVAQNEAIEANKPSLDFLDGSQKPGSLGRLGHYEVLEVIGQGG